MNELALDCGRATPEAYDDAGREALHVLNVNLIGDANRARVLRFVHARVLYFSRHLPDGSSQRITFDLRGQLIGQARLEQIRRTVVEEAAIHGVVVVVEFLSN